MSFEPIIPIYGVQVTGLESFSDPRSMEALAMLIDAVASFVMSQARGLADWIQGLVENWTVQPEEALGVSSKASAMSVDRDEVQGSSSEASRGLPMSSSVDSLDDFFDVESSGSFSDEVDYSSAIANIRDSKSGIASGTTWVYMDYLAQGHENALFVKELVSTHPQNDCFVPSRIGPVIEEARSSSKDFVFIPVVFQSTFEPHIVLFTVNLKENVIEYYDPKGDKINDKKMIAFDDMTVREFSQQLKDVSGIKTNSESRIAHQSRVNRVDCGRYVMQFMKQRLETSFAESLQSMKRLSIGDIREQLANDLSS